MPEVPAAQIDELKAILEALIYVSDEPVKEEEIFSLFPPEQSGFIRQALSELVLEYSAVPRGLRIVNVAGGYRMQTRPEHDGWIRSLFRLRHRVRLSRAALETLAIIAYRQPVTTPEIQAIRGINPMGVIQTLLERRMIRTLGRKKVVGKPILYGTTDEFLVHFGLNSLSDLPSLEEFPDLASSTPEAEGEIPAVLEGIPSSGPEVRGLPSDEETIASASGPHEEDLAPSPPAAGFLPSRDSSRATPRHDRRHDEEE
jgi:segregation and condensation protein B